MYINSYALFPYLLNDLNEILYRRPPGNATELCILYNSERRKACFFNGRKLNRIHACTVKRYNISKAKNALVSTTYWVRLTYCNINFILFVTGKAIPVQDLWVPGGWRSQIFRQSAHEGGKVAALRTGRLYPQEIFLLEGKSTPEPQCGRKDLCQWKNPVTPSGIKPPTL